MYSYASNREARIQGMKKVGTVLKRLRLKAGLTQKELADKASIRYYTWISQMEIGKGKMQTENIRPFAEALGVSPAWLARTMVRAYDPELYTLLCLEHPERPEDEDPA